LQGSRVAGCWFLVAGCQLLVVRCGLLVVPQLRVQMGSSYRDLIVWQRAIDLTTEIYRLTESFPKTEIYGLTSQIRRAAVSVPSNIAEGAGRGSKREFRQFLNVARGSICEVQTQLIIAGNLAFALPDKLSDVELIANEVGRMLNRLRQSMTDESPPSESNQRPATRN
jgi:four helix bundle protein